MKKFFVILLLLIVLVVGGLVGLVMMSFNPTAYQKQVVSFIQKLTEREVVVNGGTSITWNPIPTVVINDIRLANIDQSKTPTMMSIDKVQITIAWASLLKSPLEIKSIELTRPVLSLERLASNRSNFAFKFLVDPTFQLQEIDLLSNGSTSSTKIESIVIKDGFIKYDNQITGVNFDVTDINGSLAVDTVRGPFRFKGAGTVGKKQYSLALSTEAFQGSLPINMDVQLSEPTMQARLDVAGKLTPLSMDKWFEGSGTFSVGKTNTLLDLFQLPALGSGADLPSSGSLTLDITPTTDTLKDFVVQIGEGDKKSGLTGTFSRDMIGRVPHYTMSLGMDTLNRSEWQAYLDKLNWTALNGSSPLPDISFQAIIHSVPYGANTIRDLTLAGEYKDGNLKIDKSTVLLPGNTQATFTATTQISNEVPSLTFGIQAQSDAVSDLLAWAFPKEDWSKKLSFLKKGTYTGRLVMTPDQLTLSVDDLKVNDTSASGTISKTLSDKPTYGMKLALSNINFDSYTGWKAPEKPAALSDLPLLIKTSLEKASWVNDLNVQATIDVNDGTIFALPTSRIHLAGALADNVLRLDTLTMQNMASANLSAAGTITGVGRPQLNVDGLQLSLEAKQLALLLERLKMEATLPLIKKATTVLLQASIKGGRDGSWALETQATLSDTNIRLNGQLESLETKPTFKNLAFDIAHPNFKTFMGLVAPTFSALPKLDGTFKAKGIFSGTQDRFELTDTQFGVGLQQLNGSLTFDNQKIKTLSAKIVSPSIDLERFWSGKNTFYSPIAGFSDKAFDFSALDDWNLNIQLKASQLLFGNTNIRQADIALSMQNKELSLTKFTGTSGASDKAPVHVSGKFDWNTTPKLIANFSLQNIPLRQDFLLLSDFAFGGGVLSISGDINARGSSPQELVSHLSGKGSLNIRGGQMMGVDVEQMIPIVTRAIQRNEDKKSFEPEFNRVLTNGKTILKSITGDYVVADGIIRMMDLTLDTANATANPTQIVWDLPKRTLDISIPVVLNPLDTLPPFILGISAGGGKGIYTPNFTDLSATLSNQSRATLANDMRQRQEEAQQLAVQKRSDRITDSQTLTQQARAAVVSMEQKLKEFPFDKGQRIIQSAKDALAIVNQLSVREEPTDAQVIQQIEQARLVLIKADEFQQALEQETLFNTQNQMSAYREKSRQMTQQLETWAKAYPDIDIVAQLADNAAKNRDVVDYLYDLLRPDMSTAQVEQILTAAADATAKIEKAYRHVERFDLKPAETAPIEGSISPSSTTDQEPTKHIRGSLKRSN